MALYSVQTHKNAENIPIDCKQDMVVFLLEFWSLAGGRTRQYLSKVRVYLPTYIVFTYIHTGHER